MKIAIASDHAGYDYKNILVPYLKDQGHDVEDLGGFNHDSSDYPDHAADVAQAIISKNAERGILICGSGVGVSVAVNKFRGIRGAVCHDSYSAHQGVEHDDANVLCIGERIVGIELVKEIVTAFVKARFSNEERHVRRLQKIDSIEERNMK
jgi:ribose 5-phosphate isomerase B